MSKPNVNLSQESSSFQENQSRKSVVKTDSNIGNNLKKQKNEAQVNQKDILNQSEKEKGPENVKSIVQTKQKNLRNSQRQSKDLKQNLLQKKLQELLSQAKEEEDNKIEIQVKLQQKITNKQSQKVKPSESSFQKALKQNKLLKLIFDHFANISYANTKKKTFEEMDKKNQFMPLNRFMLFCKQFDIYSIVKFQLKSENAQSLNSISKVNHFQKTSEKVRQNNPSQILSQAGKSKMLEIPVKEIVSFEKKMIAIYLANVQTNQKMTFDNFVNAIEQIYAIFSCHISKIFPQKQLQTEQEIKNQFLENVLFIKKKSLFQQKMNNLKIEFKGSISHHQEPVKRQSEKFLKKPLVIHGGRYSEEIAKELEVYQNTKFKKTQKWINSQPQMIGIYSKSRVLYKPTPSKVYETNDVIRLARKEAGRTQTESLFDYNKEKEAQKKSIAQKKEDTITFSKIFEDKTNLFSEKLEKLKDHIAKKEENRKIKMQDKEDEILKMYFENERKTYGNENAGLSLQR